LQAALILMARHDNVQHFCWEQIHKTNRLFRISQVFAPPQMSDQLLALHALFASMELLHSEITEELVAYRKLDWWRSELLGRDAAGSRHPVVRHLYATGAMGKLPESKLRSLLDGAGSRFGALAPADEGEFRRLCQEIYRPQVLLESALGEFDEALNSFNPAMLFNGGLIQLLRESGRRKENAFWWIPLSVLARFKVNRKDLEAPGDTDLQQALFRHVFALRGQPAGHQLFDPQHGFVEGTGLAHLQLMIMLHSRQLNRLRGMSPAVYSSELARWRIGDLLAAWKMARQLKVKSVQPSA
jgi:phytoene/squalene synthetase